ncbi:glycerol acyltransferase [Massilia eurypsychrophila]|jgi:1-acyl-sn-glycerol-3-phosphate acyltransferase|uniref:Glycerol acyltransferase n=1 Tax=Massilia eurypsychrophila TaxID=1485217 RepID=A0A2G8T9B6_9BURK|nr:1-acyl-sn-glycerol-3-phosphate acyltransferase [Massilia eurypsychrophila]PIL42579.1 glycerol acyltransferase [Massilia eurypsychrophila]
MDQYALRPAALPTCGQRVSLRLLHLIGWKVRYKPLPGPHGVIVVYPHTSNWDFPVGLLAKWAVGQPFRWLGKESLFKGILGVTMRAWGGMPVERGASTGATSRLAATMKAAPWCWIALAPEGTRGHRPHWRSGFYHLALTARVPLLLVYIDYPNKLLSVVDTLELTGDQQRDMAAIAAVYDGHHGLHPELEAPIVLAPPRVGADTVG